MYLPSELPTPSNSEQLIDREKGKNVIDMKRPNDLVLLSPSNSCSVSSVTSEASGSSNSSNSSSQIPGLREASSPEKLAALLKNTYATLRSKERDLKLAAELGRSLLDNNLELKAKHDSLLQQQKQHQQRWGQPQQQRSENKSPERIMIPSTSILTRSRNANENASRWLERVDSPGGLSDTSNNSSTMRLIPQQQAHDAIVQMLTEKNKAMEASLETTLVDLNKAKLAGNERVEMLQNKVNNLQQRLDHAGNTIEVIEKQRREENNNHRRLSISEDDDIATTDAELIAQINKLKAENQRLLEAKSTAQRKLDEATQNLNQWQQQVQDYEAMNAEYQQQQIACQQQANEISLLTGAVEDYRSQLVQCCDNSLVLSDNDDEKVLVQIPNEHDNNNNNNNFNGPRPLPAMIASQSTQTNLLSELERAWTKDLNQSSSTPIRSTIKTADNNDNCAQTLQQQQLQGCLSVNINEDKLSFTQEYVPLSPKDIRDAWTKELDAVHPLMSRMPSTKRYSAPQEDENSSVTTAAPETVDNLYPPIHHSSFSPAVSYSLSSPSSSSSEQLQSSASYNVPLFRPPPSMKRGYAGAESIYAQISTSGSTNNVVGKVFMASTYSPRKRKLHNQYQHHHHQQSSFFIMIIQKIWGWYRFSLILFLAVLINLWQGPDAILEK
ncbi:hypothetical protein INT45_012762 [Circinella minor]|uniref:Uncharacterized protein n=1 Tax=Circinella minor TaxID=1195481 RepID=A0A8H7S5D3_9FUNG|nr:hypothetical protein INT45_012762 [Circinella minor]